MQDGVNVVRRGTGRPVIMVHGNGVDHRLLLPVDEAFADGWERIYVDLPGFGASAPRLEVATAQGLADWLKTFVLEQAGDRPFALVGNSFGGLLARSVVADLPEQALGLALLCPAVDPVRERRTLPARTVLRRDPGLLASLRADDREEYEQVAVIQSEQTWVRFRDSALPGIRSFDAETSDKLGASYELRDVPEERGPAFEGPTLIVTGRQDHIVGYVDQAGLLSHYPRATYAVLDEAGHNAHLEQPELVRSLFRDWTLRMAPA